MSLDVVSALGPPAGSGLAANLNELRTGGLDYDSVSTIFRPI